MLPGTGFHIPTSQDETGYHVLSKNVAKLNVRPPIAIFRQTKCWIKQQPTSQLEKKPSSNCCWNCCKFSWQAASCYRDKALYTVDYLIFR